VINSVENRIMYIDEHRKSQDLFQFSDGSVSQTGRVVCRDKYDEMR
jgi:hypothetical protein